MKLRLLLLLGIAAALAGEVSFDDILHASRQPHNWLTYSGTYASQRYSLLDGITRANAKHLSMAWVFQAHSLEKFEVTPLVVNGVMYLTQAPNDVLALDAATGRVFWAYDYRPSTQTRVCCGAVNRGLAILGDTLFMGTVDARLVALDAKNGRPLWNVEVADPKLGYSVTVAPLVVKDKVIIGMAGGEYGIRGFIAAYEAKTGKEAWRFYTIPGPGEPGRETWAGDSWQHGGASIWVTGSYDAELNLTYWGIGNPGPDWNPDKRGGDNLYSDSVVALDADSGKLKWHFQFTPHDGWDFDSVQIPVLVDMEWKGSPRKLMLWANRNGFYYVLDRVTGKFLLGKEFVKQTWAKGLDEAGRPIKAPNMEPSTQGTLVYPGVQGGTNWYSPSFSPRTGLFYISSWVDYYSVYRKLDGDYEPGRRYTGGAPRSLVPPVRRGPVNSWGESAGYGAVRALDPRTGDLRWEFKMSDVTDSGILTTASDVLFTGGREGYFYALDARNGGLLWKATVGGQVAAGPITYSVDGKQYVGVAAGHSMFVFALKLP
ncbi:MAG TPA: PQQ-dependent dehydrogenase, methanol/ethanol family [Bryobacteraceae bacterium]|nr:PQQ-dependent dehydrogenase, methanol/ethanol family [Bryobacteraceae bacterium]